MLKATDIERVVKTTRRTYGRLDAIVPCAGYGMLGPAEAFNYAQTDELMAVNVVAPAELVRQALPIMLAQGRGVIVGLSSISGRSGFPGYSLYTASKFGLEGLFEALYLELENTPVRVKLVEPSSVNTAFWQVLKRSGGRGKKDRLFAIPTAKDKLNPEQVAAAVYAAVTDGKHRLRYPVGLTNWVNAGRRVLPERLYLKLVNWLAAR
jgi:short-subunit dehydrogenase